jgi:cyclophilin family peptidyl-prolyl cis-trans isomerase
MTKLLSALLLALPLGALAQAPSTLAPKVRFETSAGAFVIEVDTVRAPLTAENFLRYVRDGFYDGLVVHRVLPNFVVQGGGYDTDFKERAGRAAIPNESGNGLSNARGTVGMARSETPHSATSQFYVNLTDNAGLNPLPSRWGYAVFGRVVEGMQVIEEISHLPTGAQGPFPAEVPLRQVVFERVTVIGEERPATTPAPPPAAPAEPATPPTEPEAPVEPEPSEGSEPAAETPAEPPADNASPAADPGSGEAP